MILTQYIRYFLLIFFVEIFLQACSERVYIFEGLKGPLAPSSIFEPVELGPEQFDHGGASRLAILITEEESHWLALASGMKTIGIPFRMTKDIETALQHETLMLYPQVTGRNLEPDDLSALREYVQGGGTLIGTNVLGGGLSDLFGFEGISESKSRHLLTFQNGFSETQNFESRGLSRVKIGSASDISANPGTNSYIGPQNSPIAVYENGEAAIISNDYHNGKTYALGVDLGQLLAKGYNRRQVDISEHYANHYSPTLDAFLIFIEGIYKDQTTAAVTLGTVPDGKSLSFMLSFDIDFSKSLKNAIVYAEHQKSEGISGTYFIQTKYVRDYNDRIFMNEEAGKLIRELESLGAEIASHSVAHSNDMWDFDLGDGSEFYPEYKPFVQTAKKTRNATIMGELRVSKFLLDHFLDTQDIDSFRPGFLSNPAQMPQALTSADYKYSSSSTANISLTHLPFQLSYGREFSAFTPIFEIPITLEDELHGPMLDRLDDAIKLTRQIADIGGSYVVLIHTDDIDTRLEFQKKIIEEVKPYAWMGTIRQFGDWWSARNNVSVDVTKKSDGDYQIVLSADQPIKGLSLEIDPAFQIKSASMPLDTLAIQKGTILIDHLEGQQTINIHN